MVKRFGALVLSIVLVSCLVVSLTGCSSETYTPSEKSPVVSAPTIGKEGVLRVGVDTNSSPYAGKTDSGIVGLNVDIAAAIADDLGLKLEIIDVGTDPGSALAAGTVDIVMGIDKSDTSVSFWVSDTYIQSGVALFSTSEGAQIPTDGSSQIAAQVSSMSAWEVSKQFGEEALVSVDDLATAFSDLGSGMVNYVAADAVIGTFAAHKNATAAKIIGMLQKPGGYGVGVLDENSDLKQLISDTLVKLEGNGMIDLIETKWLGSAMNLDSVPLSANAATSVDAGETPEGEGGEGTEGTEGEGGEETEG